MALQACPDIVDTVRRQDFLLRDLVDAAAIVPSASRQTPGNTRSTFWANMTLQAQT
jgi:hypothetical protein